MEGLSETHRKQKNRTQVLLSLSLTLQPRAQFFACHVALVAKTESYFYSCLASSPHVSLPRKQPEDSPPSSLVFVFAPHRSKEVGELHERHRLGRQTGLASPCALTSLCGGLGFFFSLFIKWDNDNRPTVLLFWQTRCQPLPPAPAGSPLSGLC